MTPCCALGELTRCGIAPRVRSRIGLAGVRFFPGLEAQAFIAGFDDHTMVGKAVKERSGHLGVGKDGGPFTEVEVGGHED